MKLIIALLLIGLFLVQNAMLFGSLTALITKPVYYIPDLCQEYTQSIELRYSSAIDQSFVLGFVSLSISLVLLYFCNFGKASKNT